MYYSDELYHHGIKGQKWGNRRYQYEDGSLTPEGRQRYGVNGNGRGRGMGGGSTAGAGGRRMARGTGTDSSRSSKAKKILKTVGLVAAGAALAAGGAMAYKYKDQIAAFATNTYGQAANAVKMKYWGLRGQIESALGINQAPRNADGSVGMNGSQTTALNRVKQGLEQGKKDGTGHGSVFENTDQVNEGIRVERARARNQYNVSANAKKTGVFEGAIDVAASERQRISDKNARTRTLKSGDRPKYIDDRANQYYYQNEANNLNGTNTSNKYSQDYLRKLYATRGK